MFSKIDGDSEMFQRLMADLNCFFTMIAKQGSERERADQDEDASGKPDNEGGYSWDFVNRLSQLKAVDIFCTALLDRPRGRRSFVNMSCSEKRISSGCIPYSQSRHKGLGSTRRTKHQTATESE
ncbi:hypothetical protein C1H46_016018 [Malus baccata]|uniref:Uncharacterized protein n=1 Tax=Malus baccata TaxID=106549 RepID=A0A540MI06_MALBA|nr:hypothetical protein C1H46_016018 [Malus baccata]